MWIICRTSQSKKPGLFPNNKIYCRKKVHKWGKIIINVDRPYKSPANIELSLERFFCCWDALRPENYFRLSIKWIFIDFSYGGGKDYSRCKDDLGWKSFCQPKITSKQFQNKFATHIFTQHTFYTFPWWTAPKSILAVWFIQLYPSQIRVGTGSFEKILSSSQFIYFIAWLRLGPDGTFRSSNQHFSWFILRNESISVGETG